MNAKCLILLSSFIVASCADDDQKNEPALPIIADFTMPTSAEIGTTVAIQNNSQHATGYKWDFGDGSPSINTAQVQHSFTARGTYHVKLLAYNSADAADVTKFIRIVPYDLFAHAGIPTTSAYLVRGEEMTNPGGITQLPNKTITVTRTSPDSIRVDREVGVLQLSNNANSYEFRLDPAGSDGRTVTIFVDGDSLLYQSFYHVGHYFTKQIRYSGRRIL